MPQIGGKRGGAHLRPCTHLLARQAGTGYKSSMSKDKVGLPIVGNITRLKVGPTLSSCDKLYLTPRDLGILVH